MDNQQPSNNQIFYQRPKNGYGYIYRYTSPSGKSYIGQTINRLIDRAKSSISGIGYKKCTLFWRAIQKYQFLKFEVEILETAPIEQLNQLEQKYIKQYHSLSPNGYNLTIGGEKGKTCEVYVYSAQNGKFLEHYNSITEASLFTNVPIETISSILNNNSNRRIAHNLTFSREYIEQFNIMLLSRENYHAVYVYDDNGIYIKQFQTIKQASENLKLSVSTIKRHLDNGNIICNLYLRDEKVDKIIVTNKKSKKGKIVRQIDPITMNTIAVYPSLTEAIKKVGLSSPSAITRAIARNGKAKGFYWQIIEGSTTKCSENPTETVRVDF